MMWPINKLKNIFISIDTQLRQQRQQLDEERQRIKKQEEQIAALRNEQKSIQRSLEENEKKLLLCTEWMDERFQKTESKLQQCEVREKQIQADRTEKEQWLNDKFYHTDVYYVNTQFRLCDMHLPGNASKYEVLQNKHRGQKCFIIGNGPSLRMEDLESLRTHKAITFASNRIYPVFESVDWRPDYYVCQDLKMLEHHWQDISSLEGMTCLYPYQLVTENRAEILQKNAILFPLKIINIHPVWFSYNPHRVIHEGMTVTFSIMQLAAFMGFSEVYLLGVDCNYPTVKTEEGGTVVDRTAQTHFIKDYWDKNEKIYQPDTKTSMEAYKSAQEYAESHEIKFFNATRGGALEAFPRVDFDEVMQSWSHKKEGNN